VNTGRQRRGGLNGYVKIALVVAVIAGAYWFFHDSGAKTKDRRPQAPIAVSAVTHRDVPVYLNGLGTVQAYNTVTVHTQVDGQLLKIAFNEGQDVHAGDVLAKIDPRTYQAQYDQAAANKAKDEATLDNARHDLQRYINLGNSIAGQLLDTQRATVRQLEATAKSDQAAIDNARAQLSYTTITSPINGRTGIRQVDVGNIVHSGDANGLVVITQVEPISVVFSLPQQNLPDINMQPGADKLPVLATSADNVTVLDTGVLELVDNQIDPATGTIKLKATFPNARRALWPGGFANVRLLVTTRKDALIIPTVAVQRGPQNNAYVFVYNADGGTVEMRTIKVAMTDQQDSMIDDGLKEGEQVVIDGMAKLQDGSKVTLADAKDSAAAPESPQDSPPTKGKHRHKQDKEE
jgi:multidrug efflux system membrane fusion protein